MTVSPDGLIRLTSAVMLGVTALAVALGRGAPPSRRFLAPPDHSAIAGGVCAIDPVKPELLDLRTGQAELWPFRDLGRLELASSSPWTDERGHRQFIGRGEGLAEDPAWGLARHEYPSGRLLDRLLTPSTPASPPCWTPGLGAEVLFAGCDGHLYQADFEGRGDRPRTAVRRVRWPADCPDADRRALANPCRADVCAPGYLVASLAMVPTGGRLADSEARLYWLGLDSESLVLKTSGPLIVPQPHWNREVCPSVAAKADGSSVLAFLVVTEPGNLGDLYVAPLRVDPITHAPRVDGTKARRLARGCRLWPPAFTPDGRGVYILTGGSTRLEIVRMPVAF